MFQFPLAYSKIDLLALVERDIKKIVLHEVPGIARCFLGDEQGPSGTEFHLKTEGINMHVSILDSLINKRMALTWDSHG